MKNILVIDDFYKDPDSVRKLAQTCSYVPKEQCTQNFPGIESVNAYYSNDLIEKFQYHLEEPILPRSSSDAFGKFRLSLKSDYGRTKVHIDNTNWSALVYLTANEFCRGGTKIYKHIETGLTAFPNSLELAALGLSQQEFDQQIILSDTLDDSKWEVMDEIEMKFNRCVFLRGDHLFHSSSELFGSNFENGRLTQNFFFNVG
jgi:hypothetical protein